MTLKCRFVKLLYSNAANGYTVAVYATKDSLPLSVVSRYTYPGHRCFTAVGTFLPCSDAVEVEMEGEWQTGKYGMQLRVNGFQELLPSTAEGIENYLGSGLLKGIGPGTAAKIVARYGEKTFEVLEKRPEELLDIPGITPDRLKTALECYEASREIRDIVTFLTPFGVSANKAVKIYHAFGGGSAEKVKENPYVLTQIHGFGFKTADAVARHLGMEPDDPIRIKEGTAFALEEACMTDGHLFFPLEKLVRKAVKLLNDGYSTAPVTEDHIKNAVYRLVLDKRVVKDGNNLYTAEGYKAEADTAEAVAKLLDLPYSAVNVEARITALEHEFNVILSPQQRQAVRQALSYSFSVITGGPGTGKTTILRFITRLYRDLNPEKRMVLMAPTGLAAKKMEESTRFEARTIHRSLQISLGAEGEKSRQDHSIDFAVMDECSMIDQRLAKRVFDDLGPKAKVLMVGDEDQLPSVGPGNVFHDLIESGPVPVTKLDAIFRQSSHSRIISNAHRINTGSLGLDFAHNDFRLVPCEEAEDAAKLVVKEYMQALKDDPEKSVQILTPMRQKSVAGSEALNETIRELVNPARPGVAEVKFAGRLFREGDRVMQTKNRKTASNGDIGTVSHIIPGEDGSLEVYVGFPGRRDVKYSLADLEDLTLAYAVTIHKSQGNEWNTVIIPVVMSFYRMLQKNLIYTAVTRAKTNVILVGSKKALFTAIKNDKGNARNTALGLRIRQAFEDPEGSLKEAV